MIPGRIFVTLSAQPNLRDFVFVFHIVQHRQLIMRVVETNSSTTVSFACCKKLRVLFSSDQVISSAVFLCVSFGV